MAGLRQFALMELKITTVSGSAYAEYGESVLLKMFTSSSNIKVCTITQLFALNWCALASY